MDANIAQHLRLAGAAKASGADLVLFPELSLTGYELAVASTLAFTAADARLDPLRAAARELGVTIVAGAPVRLDERLHIGAFIVGADGTLDLYTKQRLGTFPPEASCDGTIPPGEPTVFVPGDLDPGIAVYGTIASVAICADIGDPAHVQRAGASGANSYLASMFVIRSDFGTDSTRLRDYAARHRMVVALANHGGATGGLVAAGRSSIWSETGELIVQLPAEGTGVAIATADARGWSGVSRMLR